MQNSIFGEKWAIYFLGGHKDNQLFSFVNDCYNHYWQNNNYLIDYFFTDYCIAIAYKNINYFKNIIDDVEPNNPNSGDLFSYFNKPFNEQVFEELKSKNQFHKLTYKEDILPEMKFIEKVEEKDTFYKKLIVDGDFQ